MDRRRRRDHNRRSPDHFRDRTPIPAHLRSPAHRLLPREDRRRPSPRRFEHARPPARKPRSPDRFEPARRPAPRRRSPDRFETPRPRPPTPRSPARPAASVPPRPEPAQPPLTKPWSSDRFQSVRPPAPGPGPPDRPPAPMSRAPTPMPRPLDQIESARPPAPIAASSNRLGSVRPGPPAPEPPPPPDRVTIKAAPSTYSDRRPSVARSFQSVDAGRSGITQQQTLKASVLAGPTLTGAGPTSQNAPAPSKFKKFVQEHPYVFILLIAIAVMIILAAVAGVAVYLLLKRDRASSSTASPASYTQTLSYTWTMYTRTTHTRTRRSNGKTFYDAVCCQDPSLKPFATSECVISGAPAANSCQAVSVCTACRYEIERRGNVSSFRDATSSLRRPVPNASGLLCRLNYENRDQLGVCSKDGRCDQTYDGKDDPTWYADGVWEDGCDEPNPCWKDLQRHPDAFRQDPTRDACQKMSVGSHVFPLSYGYDAMIWMQHLRCKIGNNRTAARPCSGVPLKLWRCRQYGKPQYLLCQEKRVIKFGCNYTCDGGVADKTLPDGAICRHPDDSTAEAYCFSGTCFLAHPVSPAAFMSEAECKARRKTETGNP